MTERQDGICSPVSRPRSSGSLVAAVVAMIAWAELVAADPGADYRIGAEAYAQAMKPRSRRWRTVHVPPRLFEQISHPFAPVGSDLLRDLGPQPPALHPIDPSLGSS